MIDLAILWHLHQPVYRDPRTGEFILPWVRLHASRAYYDMAKALEPFPEVRVHLNVVPGLLDQLEAYANGTARDRFLELTEKPAADLELSERSTIWSRFFMVDWETEVKRIPRYKELLFRRGPDLAAVDLERLARECSTEELRDLQVLFNLAWTGFGLRESDSGLRELLRKGRAFSEEDKRIVLGAQRNAAQAIIPMYRVLQDRGQVELTATPHYHPILPLLIDTDCAREGLPDANLPTPFRFPQDAREQINRAIQSHTRRFGRRPTGMWPAEGSVSTAAAELFAEAGVRWIATDEGVLLRSQEKPDRSAIHSPHLLETPAGPVHIVFRDRGLSDAIGFVYAKKPAAEAVSELMGHLRNIDAAASENCERPLVSIILDGENPWEHYESSGREFLTRLYETLSSPERAAQTVRLSEALPARKPKKLSKLHAGSWIDANFRIWIGHPEDVRGWEGLGKVRRALGALEAAGGLSRERLEQAKEALLIAEGSDWFWWYGDDFTTENAAEFDALFRGYLQLACDALGIPHPPEIAEPISVAARSQSLRRTDDLELPRCLIAPHIDGRETRFGEWSGAGRLKAARSRGAMAQGRLFFSRLWFGFDNSHLFLRLDPEQQKSEENGLVVSFHFAGEFGRLTLITAFPQSSKEPLQDSNGLRLGAACGVDILEAAVPLEALGIKAGDRLELSVSVSKNSIEIQRLPPSGVLALAAPEPEFDRVHWKV